MKKRIRINNALGEWVGEYEEWDGTSQPRIEKILSNSELPYMVMRCDGHDVYYMKEILMNSIISLEDYKEAE